LQDRSTDFEFLPYDVSLGRCRRYYYKTPTAIYLFQGAWTGIQWSGTVQVGSMHLDTELRASATISSVGTFYVLGGGSGATGYTVSGGGTRNTSSSVGVNTNGTSRASDQVLSIYSNSSDAYIAFDAEL